VDRQRRVVRHLAGGIRRVAVVVADATSRPLAFEGELQTRAGVEPTVG